tara:strand:- start:1408 stop:2016 length:609 start_codon:yes stop_codon:yes gene_type:complete
MGQNSQEVAYGFGQFGSAFADASANTITAPEEMVIVAVQFLADTSLSALVASTDPYPGNEEYVNISAAANSTGSYTRTVNQGTGSSAKVIFDQENYVSQADQIELGDEVYTTSTGVLLGTVTVLDPDGDNTKEITISATVTFTNNETITFVKPNKKGAVGVGGMAIDSSQIFPKGSVIYGRWDSVSINADDADGGIITYFGR